jgi:LmbE family N-acetylglucosaminyl deacetylase
MRPLPTLMSTALRAPATSGFDVNLNGTPEQAWLDMLDAAPKESPPSGTVVVVAPHPDDETLGAGGLIALCAARRQSIRIISVTAGEAAYPDVPNLAHRRECELHSALACLSPTRIEVCQLGIPDGAVAAHEWELHSAIDEHVMRKDTLIAPFEHDGHPDHDSVGRACLSIARQRGLKLLRYPIWAWHHASPRMFHTASFVRIALSEDAQNAKRRAMECFISQLRVENSASPILPKHVLKHFMRPFEAFLTCQIN